MPNLVIVSYTKNKGRGFAIRAGLSKSRYNYVFYTDCDLPYSFSTLRNLIEQLQTGNFGMVICSRTLPASRLILNYRNARKFFIRWLGGRIINLFIRLFLGIPFKDTQAGTKGFNKEKIEPFLNQCIMDRWAFDCEIIYLCYKNNIPIKEVPTIQEFDVEETTVKFIDGIKYLIDVLIIFVKHRLGI
jgi:glycosyltransferase involved in cell wall biosynthesis